MTYSYATKCRFFEIELEPPLQAFDDRRVRFRGPFLVAADGDLVQTEHPGKLYLLESLFGPKVPQPGAEVRDRHELVRAVLRAREGLGPIPAEIGQELAHGRAAALQPGNGTMTYSGEPFEVGDGQALTLPEEANPGPDGGLLEIGDDDQAISDCFSNK